MQQTSIKYPPCVNHRDSEINETRSLSFKSWGQADWKQLSKNCYKKSKRRVRRMTGPLSVEGDHGPTNLWVPGPARGLPSHRRDLVTDSINRGGGPQLVPVDRAKCCQQPQSQVEQEKSDHHTEHVSPQTYVLSTGKASTINAVLGAPAPRPPQLSPNAFLQG